jgi:hypothetical protein
MHARGIMRTLVVLLVVILTALLAGCGGGDEELGFSGEWVSTGGEELSLQIGAPTDGEYPVDFVGGDIKRTLSAVEKSDGTYEAQGETDRWVFVMVDDELMNVTIHPAEGESATTSFKRK